MKSAILLVASLTAFLALPGCGDDDEGGTSSGTPGPLYRVVVSPVQAAMPVGTERAFTARGEDLSGRSITVHPVWSVSPPNLGRIDQDGAFIANCIADAGVVKATVSGKFSGNSTVSLTVSSGGAPATLDIEPDTLVVEAAGDFSGEFAQFYVIAKDAAGVPVAVLPAWDVVPPALGSVLNAYGFFESNATGTGSVTATVGDLTATAVLRVVAGARSEGSK
jgi:hypothetical protein